MPETWPGSAVALLIFVELEFSESEEELDRYFIGKTAILEGKKLICKFCKNWLNFCLKRFDLHSQILGRIIFAICFYVC